MEGSREPSGRTMVGRRIVPNAVVATVIAIMALVPCGIRMAVPGVRPTLPRPATVPTTIPGGGEDITVGLARTVWPKSPLFRFEKAVGEDIISRDKKVIAVNRILMKQPQGEAQCLLCDFLRVPPPESVGQSEFEFLGICFAPKMSAEDRVFMDKLGMVFVDEKGWKTMLPWVRIVVRKSETRRNALVFDAGSEVTLFSYYDGGTWRIEPWFFLSLEILENPTETDIVLFDLLAYINAKLGKGVSFARQRFRIDLSWEWDALWRDETIKIIKVGANAQRASTTRASGPAQ
jgi:hypothetical protein